MNTKIFDFIIVGGGIAGLYTAYLLLKKNKKYNILLLEKNSNYGGRIYTYRKNDIQLEFGAGRISNNHILMNKLIKDLKLDKFKYTISNKIDHILLTPSNKPKKYKHLYKDELLDIPTLLKLVFKKSKKYTKQTLIDITFQQLIKKVLSPDAYQFFIDAYEYKKDIFVCNAFDYIRLYKMDFTYNNSFFVLTCGLDKVTTCLYEKLKNNITFKNNTKCSVLEHNKNTNIFTINNKYNSKQVILALPKNAIDNIGYFKYKSPNKLLQSVTPVPLTRVYAVYPKNKFTNKVWFHDMKKITTNKKIKYIIPINENKGTIMISYTDGHLADEWGKLNKNKKKLKNKLKNDLNILFPNISIPEPTEVFVAYWKNGAHFFKSSYSADVVGKDILKPFKNICLYICGETYSKHQAWAEGSLETSKKIVSLIHKN